MDDDLSSLVLWKSHGSKEIDITQPKEYLAISITKADFFCCFLELSSPEGTGSLSRVYQLLSGFQDYAHDPGSWKQYGSAYSVAAKPRLFRESNKAPPYKLVFGHIRNLGTNETPCGKFLCDELPVNAGVGAESF